MKPSDKAFYTRRGLYGKDGRIVDSDLFSPNPLAFIAKHFSGINLDDIGDRTHRRTVSSLLAETQGTQGNINRGAAAIARQDVSADQKNLQNSPGGSLLTFGASVERLRVSLRKFEAGPGTKILNGLADGIDKLTAAMNAHPNASKNFLELVGGISALAVVGGAVSLTGIGSGLKAMSGGLSLFATGAPPAEAITFLGGTAGLAGVATGLTTLFGVLKDFPKLFSFIDHSLGYSDSNDYAHRFRPEHLAPDPNAIVQPRKLPGDTSFAHRFRPTAYGRTAASGCSRSTSV